MNHQQYKNINLGERRDYDGAYGYQCVDLARDYCRNVNGVVLPGSGGSALKRWKVKRSGFRDIPNTPNAVPPQGSIIFFSEDKLKVNYGHVAVVDKADLKSVTVIEQNALGNGNGIGDNAIRLHTYDYINPRCLGWKIKI